jgi:hypothetical protein
LFGGVQGAYRCEQKQRAWSVERGARSWELEAWNRAMGFGRWVRFHTKYAKEYAKNAIPYLLKATLVTRNKRGEDDLISLFH